MQKSAPLEQPALPASALEPDRLYIEHGPFLRRIAIRKFDVPAADACTRPIPARTCRAEHGASRFCAPSMRSCGRRRRAMPYGRFRAEKHGKLAVQQRFRHGSHLLARASDEVSAERVEYQT